MRRDDFIPDFDRRDDFEDEDEAHLIAKFRSAPFDFKEDDPPNKQRSSKASFDAKRRHGRKRGRQNIVFAPRKNMRRG